MPPPHDEESDDRIATRASTHDDDVHTELRAAQRRLDARTRELEAWRTLLDGNGRHPGEIARLEERLTERLDKLASDAERDRERWAAVKSTVDTLERLGWKVSIAASMSAMIGGGLVALLLKVFLK